MCCKSHITFHSQRFMGAVVLAVMLWMGENVQLFDKVIPEDDTAESSSKLQINNISESNIPAFNEMWNCKVM
jgi:hypothetical protein